MYKICENFIHFVSCKKQNRTFYEIKKGSCLQLYAFWQLPRGIAVFLFLNQIT